jgi:hypothetical protein
VHFQAKYMSFVPSTTADSGVRADGTPDMRKEKPYVGNVRSKIPINSSEAFSPMK